MYAWIWRKLPFGLWGKLGGSLLMLGVTVALLWYIVFPWAEPILPFDDVQVGDPESGYSDVFDPGSSTVPTPSGDSGDHDIPYNTGDATPTSSPSKKR